MINGEKVVYNKESEDILSVVKYKFGRQVSHKYFFYPDGTLAKVEMKNNWFIHNNPFTDELKPNYNREDFSYIKILFLIFISIPGVMLAFGLILFPHVFIVGMHHIYWHNKKYKFSQSEQNQLTKF